MRNLRAILSDRWIAGLLIAGLVLRLAIAVGLHWHFRDADPAHLWPRTDEALFYKCGLRAAEELHSAGWQAFLNAPPAPEYLNWAFFKYVGLALYIFGPHPFALRFISIGLSVAGSLLLLAALAPKLGEKWRTRIFAAILLLFPSVAFWSALGIKEGAVTFLTGAFCWIFARLWARPKPWAALGAAAAVCLLLGSVRIWAGTGFFAVAAAFLMLAHPGRPKLLHVIPIFAAILVGLWFIPSVQSLVSKHVFGWQTDQSYGWKSKKLPRKRFKPFKPEQTTPTAAKARLRLLEGGDFPIPVKMFLATVLPLPGVPRENALVLFSGAENVLFLALVLLAASGARRKLEPLEWAWLSMGLALLLTAVLVGTNLGTIYRTKMACLPFVAYFAVLGLPASASEFRKWMRLRQTQ